MGYFYAEQQLYENIASGTTAAGVRHPLTFILEAADDIAYRTADIEDAFKKGCISYRELFQEISDFQEKHAPGGRGIDAVGILKHQYDNAIRRNIKDPQLYSVQNWVVRLQSSLIFAATDGFTMNYDDIMAGTYPHDIFYGTDGAWVMEALGDIAHRYAFTSQPILKLEVAAGTILTFLLDKLVPAAVHYDCSEPIDMMEGKMISLISDNYLQTYHTYAKGKSEREKLYLRLLLVTDFVSGMTDSYAKNLYQELNGIQ
ncbi:hypothetical protein [Ruminococcus sp. OA3]|uniref:hypothetical protein n=1 Tax=Ruminococcus sp. OA3 TaxID=2914164 RepID=UPI0031F52FE3